MRTIWIATAANAYDEEGSWAQVVTYDPAAIIRFLLVHGEAYVTQWELPDPSGGAEPEMVGL